MSLRSELRRMRPSVSGKDFWAHIQYIFQFWHFMTRVRFERVDSNTSIPDTVAIVLSYKRPQNIDAMIKTLLRVPSLSSVVISNNNPSIDLRPYLSYRSGKVTLIQSVIDRPCHFRQDVARMFPAKQYFFIDDDLFLMPSTIERLLQHLRDDPTRIHGYFGELRDEWMAETHRGVHGYTYSVENLNRVYACTQEHIMRFMELATTAHCTPSSPYWESNAWDDILLSSSGSKKPKIHGLETPFLNCITADDVRVAVLQQKKFHTYRDGLRKKVEKLTHLLP